MTPLKCVLFGVIGTCLLGACTSVNGISSIVGSSNSHYYDPGHSNGYQNDPGHINEQPNDHGHSNGHQYQTRGGMLGYVVAKGCTYLSGFIQHMYARSHGSKDANCDWQHWVHTQCVVLHIPSELCIGLLSCGSNCSMSALRAPEDMMQSCHGQQLSNSDRDKRNHNYYSTVAMCSKSHVSSSAFLLGRRDADADADESSSSDSSSSQETDDQEDQVWHKGHVSNSSLRRWCRKFSRYIRSRYHFNEVKFVRSSRYWLVDVYKIGPKFGVPIRHTHGLVGCGMEFALQALNAPSYVSLIYTGK